MQCLRQDCHFKHSWQQSTNALQVPTSVLKNSEDRDKSRSPRISTDTPSVAASSSDLREGCQSDSRQPARSDGAQARTKLHEALNPAPLLTTTPASLSAAPYDSSEPLPAPLHTIPQALSTFPPPVNEPVSGAYMIDPLTISQSRSDSPPNGAWFVADQLEQYANLARGLRDWSRKSADSTPSLQSPSIPSTLPSNSFPLPLTNNFSTSPAFPSYPQCYDFSRPASLPPHSHSPPFPLFENTDPSLSAVHRPSSSKSTPHPSPAFDSPSSFSLVPTTNPAPASNQQPTPSSSNRDPSSVSVGKNNIAPRVKNKPRDAANPNKLLVPPIVNDLLLGVKKLGQKQVQADLEQMKREDPTGSRSERLGKFNSPLCTSVQSSREVALGRHVDA
ncbi:hypothetical protein CROQUDRAFT_566402 [Cronartium quercuum f. sp. fusiforme G11]|uniref:Uncharacterized protein n=1 Tax=Cronartium quercuum f. sp. fusiforme G11 TaxID=708437 RepID=A0A9P6NL09_9BASI|nr:hypothetical protein CROQUDRAFT_566402 [Cronartium quercuum f. sp. fusiforme G11]